MTNNHPHHVGQHPSFVLGFIIGGILGTGYALYKSEKDRRHLRHAFLEGVSHIFTHIPDLLDEFVLSTVDQYESHHRSGSNQKQLK